MPDISLAIVIEEKRWRKIPRLEPQLKRAMRSLSAHLPKRLHGKWTATVLLTGDAALRQLNRKFRGKDKPTNVLSFPQWQPKDLAKIGSKTRLTLLGDIALGYQYIVGEARNDHKILINHVTHLILHGVLHLFGYDHIRRAEAVRMEKLEQKIMAALGLPDPYAPAKKNRKSTRRKR